MVAQGVFSLCRKNQLTGVAALAFGAGLLLCCWFESEFMRSCLGVALIGWGIFLLQKK
jgi:hypothetical protein